MLKGLSLQITLSVTPSHYMTQAMMSRDTQQHISHVSFALSATVQCYYHLTPSTRPDVHLWPSQQGMSDMLLTDRIYKLTDNLINL